MAKNNHEVYVACNLYDYMFLHAYNIERLAL